MLLVSDSGFWSWSVLLSIIFNWAWRFRIRLIPLERSILIGRCAVKKSYLFELFRVVVQSRGLVLDDVEYVVHLLVHVYIRLKSVIEAAPKAKNPKTST